MQCTVLFNLTQEVYPTLPSSSRKNSLSQYFFTILLHCRWTNIHFMGKCRQGLKIDRVATKKRTVLFNLTQKVYPTPPYSSRKNSPGQHFFIILFHSRWTNVHFMDKCWQVLKIDLVPTKQRTAIFNLTEEVYPVQPSSSRKNSPSQHFLTILLHSRWTNVHFIGKCRQGLKIDRGATKKRTVLFNHTQEVYPTPLSSSRKNSPGQHFFTILFHSRWTNVHFMGKWRLGLKIDLGATKQRTVLFNLIKKVYPDQPSSSRKNSLNRNFFTFCFIPGDQMYTLWANVDRGLKSTSGHEAADSTL